MKYRILKNQSDKNVTEYPISEAEFDVDGNVRIDDDGNYQTTGRTLKWTIKSGEELQFPEYVAKILLDRFGLGDKEAGVKSVLKEVERLEKKTKKIASKDDDFLCKGCGKSFKTAKGVGLHMAHAHPELLR